MYCYICRISVFYSPSHLQIRPLFSFFSKPRSCYFSPYKHKKSDRLSPIASYLRCYSQQTKSRNSKLCSSKTNSYASYFLITSVAFVPPKPKLLDITVLSSTSRFSVTISRPLAASSRLSMLILGATKPCSSINVE